MLAKLAVLAQSKVALAVLGVVLVGGGGTAVAVAASTGHLGFASAHGTPEAGDHDGKHAHTISIEGTLATVSTCPSGTAAANPTAITKLTVKNAEASAEHEVNDDSEKATQGTPAPKSTVAPRGTRTPEAAESEKPEGTPGMTHTGTQTFTVLLNADTRVNGEHANTRADLCKALGHGVEIQSTKGSDGSLTAWKVTVEGKDSDESSEKGEGASGQGQPATVAGSISAVDAAKHTFSVKGVNGAVTVVVVNASTQFEGGAHGLAELRVGVHVTVQGTKQSNGSILATRVERQG